MANYNKKSMMRYIDHNNSVMKKSYELSAAGASEKEWFELYKMQHEFIRDEMERRKKRENFEKKKKEFEKALNQAIVTSMQQGSELAAEQAAEYFVNDVNSMMNGKGGSGGGGSKTFSVDLGVILGRLLGEAPFNILDEIFDDMNDY